MKSTRQGQHKLRNFRHELLAIFGDAKIFPMHRALRGRQRCAAGVFELFARLKQRLMPNNAEALYLLDVFIGIRNHPMT